MNIAHRMVVLLYERIHFLHVLVILLPKSELCNKFLTKILHLHVIKDSLDKSLSNLCQIIIKSVHTVTVNVSHSTVREIDTHLSDKSRSDTLK